MRIGFIVNQKDTLKRKDTGVWGEEIVSSAYAKAMLKEGLDVGIYTANDLINGKEPLDVAIHTTVMIPSYYLNRVAKLNILWIQGFTYGIGGIIPLDTIYETYIKDYKIITASRVLADKYNIPFIMPAVDVEMYRPVDKDASFVCGVSFVGNLIKDIETTYKYLSVMGKFNYNIFGGDFGKISQEDWLKLVASSKVNINFGFQEGIKWDMVTGRLLFLSACKGFCLSDKIPFFLEHFSESVAFTDGDSDSVDKINYYLQNEDIRLNMAQKAYETVLEKFTSDKLINKLISVLKGE